MDEKYIEYLYNSLGGQDKFGAYDTFKQGISTDDAFRKDFYSQVGQDVLGNYQEFESGVKKNDGVSGSGGGDATTNASQGLTGVLASKERGPVNFTQSLTPAAHLNRRQQAEFASQGGYVMAPEKAKELASTLYEKPVSEADRDMDRLIDIVGDDFQKKQDSQKWLADQVTRIQGGVFSADQAAQQSAAYAQKAITQGGFTNAEAFVQDAVQNNDYLTLRQVVNNYYGSEQAGVKREALPISAGQMQEAKAAERSRTIPNFNDLTDNQVHQEYANLKQQDYANVEEAEKKLAPIRQEQNRTNQLLDRLSSRLYSFSNPDVQQAFDQDVVGTKPLKDEITINQYSGLRYFKDNNPQLYSQLSMELAKAADPQLFGNQTYDKNNSEYKYLNYILDKKGSELNGMAIDLQLQQKAPAKAKADQDFRDQLGSLQQAMNSATTYDQRKAIADQMQLVQSQYALNPANQDMTKLLNDAKAADVNFNEKYPDYASRNREQMAKDLLQNDGLSWWGEISHRVGWLFNNTITGISNMSGGNELEFGHSRNYLRNIRKGEQQEFETFQPSESAAVQSLYRLNLNVKDYEVIGDIRNSELSRDQQLKAAADYLDANRSRIGYIENPNAGKRNWTLSSFGNQVADVGTQVIYQGALTYLTAGAARGVLGAGEVAAVDAGALAGAEGAITAESVMGPSAAISAEMSGTVNGLKHKIIELGSVFGSTYATTYQPAYQSALAAGKSVEEAENYAQQISIVNGLTETISPDIDILKRAAGGVRGLAQAVSPNTLSLAQQFGRGATALGRGYIHNVVPETLEEIAAAYGEYGVDAMYNMNQDEMNSLNNRIKNATISTVIGMTPMGILSGVGSIRNQSRMVREQFYQSGLYPDIIRSEINSMLDNNQISQDEANRRISMVNTMTGIIRDIPPRRDGKPLSDNNKVDYAFSRLKAALATNQLETTTDPNTLNDLAAHIDQEQATQVAILDAVEQPLPVETPPVPETTGNTAITPTEPVYNAGDELVNRLGNYRIVSVADGTYNVRLPDGQTEDFTADEITNLIKPEKVNKAAQTENSPTQTEISTPVQEISPTPTEISPAAPEISPAVVEQQTASLTPAQIETAPVANVVVEQQIPGEVVTGPAVVEAGGTEVVAGPVVEPGAGGVVNEQISTPINTEQNATNQISQQESVQPERISGNESGETTEAGGSNRLQREETGNEGQAQVNENAGLSVAEQDAIGEMSKEQLYNNILDIEPDSPVRGRLPEYSLPELQSMYKASLSDYSRGLQQPATEQTSTTTEPNWTTAAPMQALNRSYNQARDAATKAKQTRDKVTNKNSTEYQDRNADYQKAAALVIEAENNKLEGLKKQNKALRDLQGRALGISPEGNAKANARVIANYIEMAKIYARKGIRTLADFAHVLGEDINDYMRRAWEITGGNQAPTQSEDETYKSYLKRLREWETTQLSQGATAAERGAIRQLTAELRTGAKNLRQGIALMDNDINISRESFNQQLGLAPNDFLTYVAALKETIQNVKEQRRAGNEILNSLREAHPKEVIAAEMDILRLQLAASQQNVRESFKEGKREKSTEAKATERARLKENLKGIRNQVQTVLDAIFDSHLLDSGTFNQNDLQELSGIINNISTEKQINNLKSLFQRLVTNSSEAETLESVTKLQQKLGKIIKNKESITANMQRKGGYIGNKTILRALKNLNPMKITQPLRYNAILDNVVNSLAGTATLEYSNQQIADFINTQTGAQRANDAADLKSRYSQTLNILGSLDTQYNPDQVLNQDEFDGMVDQISNDPNLSDEQRINELGNLYTSVVAYENEITIPGTIDPATGDVGAQLGDIFEQVRTSTPGKINNQVRDALADIISDDQLLLAQGVNFPVTDAQAQWVRQISQLDPTRLQPKQLALLKNVIDNILTNQDFSAAQYFSAVFESQERADKFQGWTVEQQQDFKKDSFGADGLISSMVNNYGAAISSSDQIILTMANNSRDYATRLMDVTSLGDIKALHAQAQQVIDHQISEPLRELRKVHKDLRTAESTYKRGMYAFLNENNYGTPEDIQKEFDRRKRLVAQDVAIKEQLGKDGDTKVAEEATILRKIYDENFAGINSQQQLEQASILNPGEKAVYDLFRNFYDNHKEAFREVMESLLNQPFHEVNNYVKDSYRILETGLTDADFRDIDQSNFYTERDQAAPSTATMQRNTFDDMDNIAIRDMEGNIVSRRAINYNFDLAQLNNARGMVEDIHTLKARIMAKMALNDPALRETVGLANSRRLASTIKQQVQQSLGLYAHTDQGIAGKWAERTAANLNKIGVHMTLFSLSQIPKQQVDIITNTAVNLGTDAGLYFSAWNDYAWIGQSKNEDINELLAQSEIGVRGKTMGGTNWMTPTALSQLQALMGKMGVDAEITEAPWLARWTIEGADTHGAKVAWLAYYMQSLKRQGLIENAKQVDWAKENRNINKEARDYAQLMTSSRLNVNARESQSEFFSKFAGFGRLFQTIMLPFSSFNMNNYATMFRDINTLFTSDTKEQRMTAYRSIASRAAAELAFQIVRGGLSLIIKEGVRGALMSAGIEPPQRNLEGFWKKVFSESVKNMMFGMLGNWSIDAITTGVNWMSDKAFDKKIMEQYDSNPNSPANNFGMASIAANTAQGLWNYGHDIIGRTDPNGNPVEITTGEKAVIATAFLMNLAAMRGLMPGELKQIADNAAKKIDQRIKVDAKDPYWIMMNNPDAKPDISINGRKVKWSSPDMLKFYQEQKSYHINEMKDMPWTDKYKSTEATARAKIDLQLKYGTDIEYEEKK